MSMPEETIHVKLNTGFPYWKFCRQTPGGRGLWGNCVFYENDDFDTPDYWIVYDGICEPVTAACPKERRILFTGEPEGHKSYSPSFVAQFGTVVTSHQSLGHPGKVLRQQALPWLVGIAFDAATMTVDSRNAMVLEELVRARGENRANKVSVVVSAKDTLPGHRLRMRFLEAAKEALGDSLDVFGVGYRPVVDKFDAMLPYIFHLSIENSQRDHYWTEKLSDALIAGCFPIYHGCPNIRSYFSGDSLAEINIADVNSSINEIRRLLRVGVSDRNRKALREARSRVFEEYNFFEEAAGLCKPLPIRNTARETILPDTGRESRKGFRTLCRMIRSMRSIQRKIWELRNC